MSATEDEAAVDEVLAGNVSAFEAVVRRWERPLVNLAFRFFRDRGKAEEMAQEAFLRAYRSLAVWRRESSFSTWLFAVATNLYRSERKRRPWDLLPTHDTIEAPEPDQQMALEDRERTIAVQQALETLPAKYRDVLVLFYFHDMDVAATGASLELPEGTVKARLARGRDLLSKKLKAHEAFARKWAGKADA